LTPVTIVPCEGPDATCVEAELRLPSRAEGHRVHFKCRGATPIASREAFLIVGLIPAMRSATALVVDGPVSARLLSALQTIVDIYRVWDPSFHLPEVIGATPATKPAGEQARVGVFSLAGSTRSTPC